MKTQFISFRVSYIEKKAIAMAAETANLSTSEFARRTALNKKVTLRFTEEELEIYKNLHTYHRNFKLISNLIKSPNYQKNKMVMQELEEVISLIREHLKKFEQ